MKHWEHFVWPIAAAAGSIVAWHLGVRWSGTHIFPSPPDVRHALVELAHKGLLLRYLSDSLGRVGIGYGLGVACGVPSGMMLGWYPAANTTVNPVIQMLRPI